MQDLKTWVGKIHHYKFSSRTGLLILGIIMLLWVGFLFRHPNHNECPPGQQLTTAMSSNSDIIYFCK